MNRAVFSCSILSLLAVRLVDGVRAARTTRGVGVSDGADTIIDSGRLKSAPDGAGISPESLELEFGRCLPVDVSHRVRHVGPPPDNPVYSGHVSSFERITDPITNLPSFKAAINQDKYEDEKTYIRSLPEDVLRLIQPADPECVAEMKAIIDQHLVIRKDFRRSMIGPENVRGDEGDIRLVMTAIVGDNWNFKRNPKPYFQGMGKIANAMLLHASDRPGDPEARLQVATDRAKQIFQKNWFLNKCIIGEEGKIPEQAFDDVLVELSAKLDTVLRSDDIGRDFLQRFAKEVHRDDMTDSYQLVEFMMDTILSLFQRSTADLKTANRFLELFEEEPQVSEDDMGILPYLVAGICTEFLPEIESVAAAEQNCGSLILGIVQVVSNLSEYMTFERAEKLISTAKFMQIQEIINFETQNFTVSYNASTPDYTISIGEHPTVYETTKTYQEFREIASDLGHVCRCCGNIGGFPGWYYHNLWDWSGSGTRDKLQGWANDTELKLDIAKKLDLQKKEEENMDMILGEGGGEGED